MPQVVHVRDRIPGAVFIGRPGFWGNPFFLPAFAKDSERAECVAKYEKWLLSKPDLIARAKAVLRGHDLACYCRHAGEARTPANACHGDILLLVANEEET